MDPAVLEETIEELAETLDAHLEISARMVAMLKRAGTPARERDELKAALDELHRALTNSLTKLHNAQ